MLKKKYLPLLVAILALAYSCKKTEMDSATLIRPPILGGAPGVVTPAPSVSTRDTTKDTTTYQTPWVTVSTGHWIDSTNGLTYGTIISTVGIIGYPNSFGAPQTSKIIINPNGSMVITLPSGKVINVNADGTVVYIGELTVHEMAILDAVIQIGKKKRAKKPLATSTINQSALN
jgi:hypothetical protein